MVVSIAWTAGIALVLWVLASMKTSRPDGERVRAVHPYRRLMWYIMPTRTESLVYFDTSVDARPIQRYAEKVRERCDIDISHLLVAAVDAGLRANPRMNRFIVGRRLYQRDGRWVTFSMKRKAMDSRAKLSVVKLRMVDDESIEDLVRRINDRIGEERSGEKTYADKEYSLFNLLPRPVLWGATRLLRVLDYYNLMPGAFIETDGLYTSVFIANLGSIGMAPGYHHLFEWGTCPLFMMVGKIRD